MVLISGPGKTTVVFLSTPISIKVCRLRNWRASETRPWPKARLSYANALLPEASLSAAIVSGDAHRAGGALDQLRGLVERQTLDGHFSFAPVGGCDAFATPPMFDQQPVEAWAMASAC